MHFMAKRKYSKAHMDEWRHDAAHPSTFFQGRPDLDGSLETDIPEQQFCSVLSETIPAPDLTHPAIGLISDESTGSVSAWFGYHLVGVVSEKFTGDGKPSYPSLTGLSAFSALLTSLAPDERLYVVIGCEGSGQQGFHISYEIHGCTHGDRRNVAVSRAQTLMENVNVALALIKTTHLFAPLDEPPTRLLNLNQQAFQYHLDPVSLRIRQVAKKNQVGFSSLSDPVCPSFELRLPLPMESSSPFSLKIVPALLASSQSLTMLVELQAKTLTDDDLVILSDGLDILAHGATSDVEITLDQDAPGVLSNETRQKLAKHLEFWLHRGKGYTCSCFAFSNSSIPSAALALSGSDLYGGRSVSVAESCMDSIAVDGSSDSGACIRWTLAGTKEAGLDLSHAYHATQLPPALLPKSGDMVQLGFPQYYDVPPSEFALQGIVLGNTQDAQEVRFAESDRTRHCYVMGATGTGKSTLLYNMLVQDMLAGRGVGLIDPHGDLYRQVLEAVPARRIKDVILINPADGEYSAGVNFLEIDDQDSIREKSFVVNELIQIIYRLYAADTMGPGFERMFRNALALLLNNTGNHFTLIDLPRVFEDADFRDWLVSKCKDPIVVQFWRGSVLRMTGDQSLSNWTHYIVSKLTPFIDNPSVRRIIGQGSSTINFRKALDDGSILLINLPKGEIGSLDTAFLGMLTMGKILGAALSRAKLSKTKRRPFHLYVDEFQNFTTDSVATLLAEARKYGLYLTFANQNMAQLPKVLLETVLGNVGTRFFMRSGIGDAPIIEPSLKPYLSTQDILSLPDYHVAGRMLTNNMPSKPLVFKTLAPIAGAYKGNALLAHIEKIIQQSRGKYAKPVGEVDAAILKSFAL